ncbi:hypothetical protein [uncultured Desulfuromonas sp.]|uniref:hypothetical protein n=1 Tax=uncultured Desulfuromonas sp. TaxID=181013 RepID=UPI002AAB057E|nr:hypothetical protein [uncultured Desulfuromonas sp.]
MVHSRPCSTPETFPDRERDKQGEVTMPGGAFNDAEKHFDSCLTRNCRVCVFWTENGFSFHAVGKVVTLSANNVTVALSNTPQPAGLSRQTRQVTVPRYCDQTRWSAQTCVTPVGAERSLSAIRQSSFSR